MDIYNQILDEIYFKLAKTIYYNIFEILYQVFDQIYVGTNTVYNRNQLNYTKLNEYKENRYYRNEMQ